MYDNLLAKYTLATGGTLDSERGMNGIQKSYAGIAEEARNQYTLATIATSQFSMANSVRLMCASTGPGWRSSPRPATTPPRRILTKESPFRLLISRLQCVFGGFFTVYGDFYARPREVLCLIALEAGDGLH